MSIEAFHYWGRLVLFFFMIGFAGMFVMGALYMIFAFLEDFRGD